MIVPGSSFGGIKPVAGEIYGNFTSGLTYNAASCNVSVNGEVSAGRFTVTSKLHLGLFSNFYFAYTIALWEGHKF